MSTELIKVEEFTSLMKSAPDALGKNQKSIANCNSAGQAILDTIQGEGMTDELDAKAAEYLKKVNVTITNMKSRRAPVTQLFDRIRSIFTTDEKAIDPKDKSTIPGKIAAERDRYAALKREEERRKQQEMQRQANIEKEKGTYRLAIEQAINTHVSSYFAEQQKNLSHIWESITLATFELKEKSIRGWSTLYPREHFDTFNQDITTYYLDAQTKANIKAEILYNKYSALSQQYKFDMEDLRQSFIDRLSSKKQELIEEEELRKKDAEAAAKAETERKQREEEERKQRELEIQQKEHELQQKAESSIQSAQMNSLFATAAASVTTRTSKAKVTERIKILHPAGFLEIYQMWWINEGQNLTIEELEKIHKKMISFCEKKANSDDEMKIKSKYIRYEEEVKAGK
ncbi:hypothetical protein F9959_06505 [Bacteroides stercoris]|jgi:hypothetical protein|uniref:Uncharacterized protein n=1 Tax=Bacteroides stercoris TaxID=46506 RepID=A0A7J5L613_BACSE|nr:hypothetical protein [Bacteroides stercoris]KAB5263854.1 hypothetical protein F9968_06065 [Bacteroides stercoris]KAB5263948.1 hypothetical protein F9966_05510 [Bacteroides stercoris]KAB5282632.1 hypothetical protein F9962_05890 [Bacteroides stercoris]KAB5285859.1 hypothetical protein F9957_06080 [Bacteroides stercoris]KAB5286504.1 hypothetical protein F9964_08820 [Bacteroides stercoris]